MSSLKSYLCPLLLLCAATVSHAQFDSGAVLGTVRDSSGAVLTETSIVLKSINTGTQSITMSNSAGDYTFNSVLTGDYVVAAQHAGFKNATTATFTGHRGSAPARRSCAASGQQRRTSRSNGAGGIARNRQQ